MMTATERRRAWECEQFRGLTGVETVLRRVRDIEIPLQSRRADAWAAREAKLQADRERRAANPKPLWSDAELQLFRDLEETENLPHVRQRNERNRLRIKNRERRREFIAEEKPVEFQAFFNLLYDHYDRINDAVFGGTMLTLRIELSHSMEDGTHGLCYANKIELPFRILSGDIVPRWDVQDYYGRTSYLLDCLTHEIAHVQQVSSNPDTCHRADFVQIANQIRERFSNRLPECTLLNAPSWPVRDDGYYLLPANWQNLQIPEWMEVSWTN